jgi:predicted ATPase
MPPTTAEAQMASSLDRITIEGFKSIRSLRDFKLDKLNLLVGANGAGKSNLVEFFRLLRAMSEEGLASFVVRHGKADTFLFSGPKATDAIDAHLAFEECEYRFTLRPTVTGELIVDSEAIRDSRDRVDIYTGTPGWLAMSSASTESGLKSWKYRAMSPDDARYGSERLVYESVSRWSPYHFNDTTHTAPMRRVQDLRDFRELRPDAGNIAAFLHHVRAADPIRYQDIRYHIQLVAPFFDDFLLEPEKSGPDEQIRLEWRQKGTSKPLQPHQFSDGIIRFICLATALLQPDPPPTIVIDEPELGLHPFALGVLASLLRQASAQTQIIVSTQSATLLDTFEPEEVIIVDRFEGASRFRRLQPEPLQAWLENYTLGQLWQKNVIEAGPVHE